MTTTELPRITARQREVLEHVRAYIATHGYSPTYREIGGHLGIRINAVVGHLRALTLKGYVTQLPGKNRTLRLTEAPNAI